MSQLDRLRLTGRCSPEHNVAVTIPAEAGESAGASQAQGVLASTGLTALASAQGLLRLEDYVPDA
jgi:hypothetical protein